MKYYVVTTEFAYEGIKETIARIAKSSMCAEAVQAEVAQGIISGHFDESSVHPLFEREGLEAYPDTVKVVDENTFKLLQGCVEYYPTENDESNLPDGVQEFLKAKHYNNAVSMITEFGGSKDEVEQLPIKEIIRLSRELTSMENCLADS